MVTPGAPPGPRVPLPLSPQDDRLWAALVHLAGIPFGIMPALVCHIVFAERGPLLRHHSAQALSLQICWMPVFPLLAVVGVLTAGVGFLLFFVVFPMYVAVIALAAWRASRGSYFCYPLLPRFEARGSSPG